jgi:outer membrane lipoprotein-sorting protein
MRQLSLVGVVVLLVAALSPPFMVTGNQVVAPILERMGQAFSNLQTLKASLQQQKTYSQLGMSDPVEHGALYIKRKTPRDILVRLEITQPMQRIITVKDSRFVLFQPAINQVLEGKVDKNISSGSSAAGFLSYFFGGISKATQDYHIAAVGDELVEGRRTTHLKLTPMAARKGLYQQIDLWVDHQFWMPTQQRFVEANQEITALRLIDVKVNVNVSDQIFTQKIPAGVQRVRG